MSPTPAPIDGMLDEPCITCGARPGHPCVTKSGKRTRTHAPRFNIYHVKQVGWDDGRLSNEWAVPVGGFIEPSAAERS